MNYLLNCVMHVEYLNILEHFQQNIQKFKESGVANITGGSLVHLLLRGGSLAQILIMIIILKLHFKFAIKSFPPSDLSGGVTSTFVSS